MNAPRPRIPKALPLVVVLLLAGCGNDPDLSVAKAPADPNTSATPTDLTTAATEVVPLPDGYLTAGRYSFVVRVDCEGVTDDPIACPEGVPDPPPIPLEVTVPDGWVGSNEFHLIEPAGAGTDAPDGGALVMGWTSNTVRVQSEPCLSKNHQLPDVEVGRGVDDFVDVVTSQRWFNGKAPVDTRIGGAAGRYFSLRGPADLSGCEEWRPWDPGFYAQGPKNIWEVWVLDVGGHRVLIVIDYFPGTPKTTVAQLRDMVKSIRFTSA